MSFAWLFSVIDELTVTEPVDDRMADDPTSATTTFVTSFTRKEPVAENRLDSGLDSVDSRLDNDDNRLDSDSNRRDSEDNTRPKTPEELLSFASLGLDGKNDLVDLLRNLGWLPIPEEIDRLSDDVKVAVMLIPE